MRLILRLKYNKYDLLLANEYDAPEIKNTMGIVINSMLVAMVSIV